MTHKPGHCLMWEGASTLAELHRLIESRQSFELQLPPDFHFALHRHLYPDAPPAATEQIQIEGDVALLRRTAEVRGLTELGELVAPLEAAAARIAVYSPGPSILVLFPPGTP